MSSCYLCGNPGADFRRSVVTGRSRTIYYGKRSNSMSSSTHTGLRSVCENCAFNVDKSRIITRIIGLWILNLILVGLIIHYKF